MTKTAVPHPKLHPSRHVSYLYSYGIRYLYPLTDGIVQLAHLPFRSSDSLSAAYKGQKLDFYPEPNILLAMRMSAQPIL